MYIYEYINNIYEYINKSQNMYNEYLYAKFTKLCTV